VNKRVLLSCFKYLLGIGLLVWVVWANRDGLRQALAQDIRLPPLLLALALCLLGGLLTFVRWYILVRAQGLPFTLVGALRLGLIGYSLNTFLPGSIGGDIVKAACIAREQSRRTVAVATVLIDRVIGLCGLFWLVALLGGALSLTGQLDQMAVGPEGAAALRTITLVAAGLAAASVVFWLLLGALSDRRAGQFAGRLARIPKVGPALAELWRAVWMYRCRGRSVGLALALAMLGHVGFVLTFYFAARTLASAAAIPSLGAHFLLVPVGMAIKAGVPTPGGIGGGEAGFGWLYDLAGFAFGIGVLAALVERAIEWVLGLTGYFVYLRLRSELRPQPEDEPAPEPAPEEAAPEAESSLPSAAVP
jgi:glycosyltransferase 2 family protein